jgi:hypothetical protein
MSKTIVLGPEYDERLQSAVLGVIAELGGMVDAAKWAMGGSQEIVTCNIALSELNLILETETYIGLSISGDEATVEDIAQRVQDRMARISDCG